MLNFFCDPAGARTQDPNIKSVVLYQLSYRVISLNEGANIKRFINIPSGFLDNFLFFCCNDTYVFNNQFITSL